MARDVQIKGGIGAAPQAYSVPNATEIIPRAVNATFDGSGAAGSFLPTLEIISDGGVVIARIPCDTTVAAGDSAEVTFAPFLRAASGSASAGYSLVEQDAVPFTPRSTLNFTGTGVTVSDDPGNLSTDVDISAGAGYALIEESGAPFPQRTAINFLGAGVSVADDPGNNSTDVTISGGGGGGLTTTAELITLGTKVVAGGTNALLNWSHVSGTTLLNFSPSNAPTIIASGFYSLIAEPQFTLPSIGTSVFCDLLIGGAINQQFSGQFVTTSGYTVSTDGVGLVMPTMYLAAGTSLEISVFNSDSASVTFLGPSAVYLSKLG